MSKPSELNDFAVSTPLAMLAICVGRQNVVMAARRSA